MWRGINTLGMALLKVKLLLQECSRKLRVLYRKLSNLNRRMKMKPKALLNDQNESTTKSRIRILFGFLIVIMACSAGLGTQSVRASTSCTSAQCTSARNYAAFICDTQGHSGLADFTCPVVDETDDFYFICNDSYWEFDDCGTHLPS